MLNYLAKIFPTFLFAVFTVMSVCSLIAANSAVKHKMIAISRLHSQRPDLPKDKPMASQANIDRAMEVFNIHLPGNVGWPRLDLTMEDRGVTIMDGWGMKRQVKIGPEAFSSWSILGSTLAHEIEVHGEQSFLWIRVLNLIGLKGTVAAEREAYLHEIRSARRFGLKRVEVQSIEETMNFYYSVDGSGLGSLPEKFSDKDD